MELYMTALRGVVEQSGFVALNGPTLVMLLVSFILLYLAIAKGFEPLLLMPIAFGCLLVNLPLSGIVDPGGFLYFVKIGIDHELYPVIIFMGIGALTDFGPLLANPITFLLGAAAQIAYSSPSSARCSWASRSRKRPVSESSAALTARRPFTSARSLPRHPSRRRRRRLQLHVARSAHPAARHQASDDEKDRSIKMEQLRPVTPHRAHPLPDRFDDRLRTRSARLRSPRGNADVREPHARVRLHRASFARGAE